MSEGQIIGVRLLNSSGSIRYNATAHLLLQSSFETSAVQYWGPGEWYLTNIKDVNGTKRANYGNTVGYWASATAEDEIWIDTGNVTAHSGSKCLGLMASKQKTGVRACWGLTRLDGSDSGAPGVGLKIQGDIYVSIWLYFPSDWNITTYDPSNPYYGQNWYELMNLIMMYEGGATHSEADNPKLSVHIHRYTSGAYSLDLDWEGNNTANHVRWHMINPFDISTITGKWTHWAWFIHRTTDYTQAYVKFWLNGVLLGTFNDTNPYERDHAYDHMYTAPKYNPLWYMFCAKVYLVADGTHYHYLWADDLEVWDGIP